jgi:hypothetical protein
MCKTSVESLEEELKDGGRISEEKIQCIPSVIISSSSIILAEVIK